ncbi:hypothetical protein AB838_18760 [Rhodobacteraceae bacterium (ex Bugula neritina AB1)]|nr:hypothetical protein AB838_18760 [Rhodobacteraceae bacterium (ex Bugula neritina AB1)]
MALALLMLPVAGFAKSTTVSTLGELYAAMAQARGGETILLRGGEYGKLVLQKKSGFNYAYPREVTLRSANPDQPAVFSGADVRGAGNLTFEAIVFDYRFKPGTPVHAKPFKFIEGRNLTIRNSIFDGDVARGVDAKQDGLGYGIGAVFPRNRGLVFEYNEIYTFHRGMTMGKGFNATIRGNDIHSIRSDGMNFSQMQGVLIEANYIHDFIRSKLKSDHADMIQFWTNRTDQPSTDITIRGNVLMAGNGNSTQTIFMRNDMVDRGLKGREMFYRNVVIEDNVIVNGHVHGITLGEAAGVRIRNNTLLRGQAFAQGKNRSRKAKMPRIKVAGASTDVQILRNLGATFQEPQFGWDMRDNLVVQDIRLDLPGAYPTYFKDALHGPPDQLETFVYLPGGLVARQKLGATLLQPGLKARARFAAGPGAAGGKAPKVKR